MIGAGRAADGQNCGDPGLASALKHGVAIFIELRILEVRVGVDDFQRGPVAPAYPPASYEHEFHHSQHLRADYMSQLKSTIQLLDPPVIAAPARTCARKMPAGTPALL